MLSEQILIFFQIIFIDLVLAGDNAIIIGMVASQFPSEQRKKIIFWGIGAAVILRILFTLITAYLLQISGLRLIGGILLLYICYKLYVDVVKQSENIKILGGTNLTTSSDTEGNITVDFVNPGYITSGISSGDNVSELTNDAGYLTRLFVAGDDSESRMNVIFFVFRFFFLNHFLKVLALLHVVCVEIVLKCVR